MYVLTCILVKLLWIALLTNQSLYVYRWLNGFNDNLSGFPRLPCKYIPCSPPYMGDEQPGAPVDASKALQGPYGTGAFVQCDFVFCIVWYELLLTRLVIGMSGPIFGLCPTTRDWIKESSGNPKIGKDWVTAPPEVSFIALLRSVLICITLSVHVEARSSRQKSLELTHSTTTFR